MAGSLAELLGWKNNCPIIRHHSLFDLPQRTASNPQSNDVQVQDLS